MFVVGGVCLIGYGFWEAYGAKFPSAPGRILKNRTVITAIIIDVIYLLAGCECLRGFLHPHRSPADSIPVLCLPDRDATCVPFLLRLHRHRPLRHPMELYAPVLFPLSSPQSRSSHTARTPPKQTSTTS
jgi:hypothetical protein